MYAWQPRMQRLEANKRVSKQLTDCRFERPVECKGMCTGDIKRPFQTALVALNNLRKVANKQNSRHEPLRGCAEGTKTKAKEVGCWSWQGRSKDFNEAVQ